MQVNQPRVRVLVDGLAVPGVVAAEIESLGYFAAARFQLVFAMGASAATDMGFFAALTAQALSIDLALGDDGFVRLLTGQIDNVRIDVLESTATVSGRDLAARLIDAEISESFANQTASQIAVTLAARHGLTPNVAVTQTPVGQYYELDHARSGLGVNARATTAWNLLCWLAQAENFAVSVSGTTLNFGPPAVASPVLVTPASFMTLVLDTATTIPATVMVKSWNSRNKMVNTGMAGSGAGIATTIVRPNLTAALANNEAAYRLAALGRHATILQGTMPGELVLGAGGQVVLAGTDSALDGIYGVEAVTRTVDGRAGFTQRLRAYAVAA